MMDASFFEIDGVIVRVRPYFDDDDTINRISVSFIEDEKRISFNLPTWEFSELLEFLNKEVARANERKYIP